MVITSIKAGIINGTKIVNAVMQTLGRFVLFEFKHSELSTFHGGYLLNVSVLGVGFSVAGLDRAKFFSRDHVLCQIVSLDREYLLHLH